MKDSYEEIFGNKQKVMVVFAHPDDAEIVAGGLISRLTSEGKEVRIIVTTNGGKGVQDKKGISESDFANERIEEQKKAGEILGVSRDNNFNLNIPDGELEHTFENIGKIVFHIREFKPDAIVTHNPQEVLIKFNAETSWVNHRDHRNTGLIVTDASYPYSRDRGFFPEHFEKGLTPHKVTELLFADSYSSPNLKYFEINKYIEQKLKALRNHPSALDPNSAEGFLEENKYEGGYFEPLGYWTVY